MDEIDIERVLITEEQIRRRVRELAAELRERMGPGELTLVGVLTGAFVFLADLVREIPGPVRIDFLRASSYRDATVPGALEISDEGLDVAGRDVVLVEDIVDTGRSFAAIRARLMALEPRSLTLVALLDKPSRRQVDVEVDLTGFPIPDEFVVGYGLDFAERHRNLPYVGVLERGVYEAGA